MYQQRCLRLCKPSLSVISAAFMALGRSWRTTNTANEQPKPWHHPLQCAQVGCWTQLNQIPSTTRILQTHLLNHYSIVALFVLVAKSNRRHETREDKLTCLLANTSRKASFSSSSDNIRISSSFTSWILSRSLLSTTKMRPEGAHGVGNGRNKDKCPGMHRVSFLPFTDHP